MPEPTANDYEMSMSYNKNTISDLFILLIWTSIISTVINSILAWKLDVTLTAIKALTLVLSVYGASGVIYLLTNNLGVVAITMVLYMGLAVLVGSQWLALPLIIMLIVFCWMTFGGAKNKIVPRSSMLLGSSLATLLILGAEHYGNFLIMNNLLSANIHKDTLFHASIASMIKNYHVVSTGLHGLVETPYHVLSHIIFAAFSILAGISVLEAYGFFQIIFLSPMLVFSLAYAATMRLTRYSDEKGVYSWVVICIFLFIAKWVLSQWALWDSYFISESYCLSLVFLLLSLPTLMSRSLGTKQLVVVNCLIILAGLAKGSVGIIGIELLWLRWIFLTEHIRKTKTLLPIFISSVIFYFLVVNSAKSASELILIRPLSIVYHYSFWGTYLKSTLLSILNGTSFGMSLVIKSVIAVITFFLLHFSLSWGAIFIGIKEGGWRASVKNPVVLFSLGASGAGILVALFFLIPGGAVYYFTSVAFFVSLPAVASWVVDREWLAEKTHKMVIGIMLITIFCLFASKEANRKSIIVLKNEHINDQLISNLITLRDGGSNKSSTIYNASSLVAPSAKLSCSVIPFVYTAVSEQAWVGLIKVDSGCSYEYYGYSNYFTDKTDTKLIAPVIPCGTKIVTTKME